jgi:PAS domain S-box-containing protein
MVTTALALAVALLTPAAETRLVVFAVAVMVSAWAGGWKPGLLATGFAVSENIWFFVPPYGRGSEAFRTELFHLLLFIGLALLICWFNAELRSAQEALERSEEHFRSLVVNSPYGICRCAPDGTLQDANPTLAAMLGFDWPALLLGLNLLEETCARPEDRAALADRLRERQQFDEIDLECRRRDGKTITVLLSGRPIRDDEGSEMSFELFAEDITERRALEQQLRSSQKMEAIGRLAGGIAHDFNNLLMVISGYCEFLLERVGKDPDLKQPAEEIRNAADRATSLTRQLLAFSRRQVLDPKILNLNDVVAENFTMLPRLIGEDIELVTVAGKDLWNVKADRGQIEQVIMNLVVNARDAMPDGGRLVIETANVSLDDAYVRQHPAMDIGDYVMLAISDTGIGMDAETQSHIFEPFFTTKGQKGTGLGLSTVYGIVKQSGGAIWVYSEPTRGTTFKVYLPRVAGVPEPARVQAPAGALAPGRETVLLVEDEANVRKLTRELLERQGYTVLEAVDGAHAIQLSIEYAGHIDLLLTDVIMPGINGRELADKVTLFRPGVSVLFMSGYTEDTIGNNNVLEEGASFLPKPFTFEALSRKVRQVLEERGMQRAIQQSSQPLERGVRKSSWPERAQRFKLHIPIQYRAVGQVEWRDGTTENISRSGVLFRADGVLEPNAQVEITLMLPFEIFGLSSTEVFCKAEVVRTVTTQAQTVEPAVAAKFLNYHFHRGAGIAQA